MPFVAPSLATNGIFVGEGATGMDEDVRTIELRRLRELEKQRAIYGPRTDPAVLVEIQELYHKHPDARHQPARNHAALDYDFLMNSMAAALQRLTLLEQRYERDSDARQQRQRHHDVWMGLITALVIIVLILQLILL